MVDGVLNDARTARAELPSWLSALRPGGGGEQVVRDVLADGRPALKEALVLRRRIKLN